MFEEINSVTNFDGQAIRNIIGLKLQMNPFDDLSDDPLDWKEAEMATDFHNRFSLSELEYNVIRYVFDQHRHQESRFSDGSFPVWYGALELETTFYESIYHWKRFLAFSSKELISETNEPIYCARSAFKASCKSTLIDLRDQTITNPSLISNDSYQDTQSIGLKLSKEGFPGLITKSARHTSGTNLAIFKHNVLSSPAHYGDYLYELMPDDPSNILIRDFKTRELLKSVVGA